MRRTLTVQEDPQTGDLFLELTKDLMDEMGWSVGDDLLWTDNENGTWSLEKKHAPTLDKT